MSNKGTAEPFDYSIVGLFATKIGAPDYEEQFITEGHTDKIKKATEWAKANGFDRIREIRVNGSIPDFKKGVNL